MPLWRTTWTTPAGGSRLGHLSWSVFLSGQVITRTVDARSERLAVAGRSLEATSPFAVLARGYSITRPIQGGAPLTKAEDLASGEKIETLFHSGSVISEVEEVRLRREGEGTD